MLETACRAVLNSAASAPTTLSDRDGSFSIKIEESSRRTNPDSALLNAFAVREQVRLPLTPGKPSRELLQWASKKHFTA